MSVPPLFKIPKNILFSIGLASAENTFYQISEKELKKQIGLLKETKKHENRSLPNRLIVRGPVHANSFDSSETIHFIEEKYFDSLFQKMMGHLDKKQIWIRDSYSLLNFERKLKIRHINENPKDDLLVLKAFSKPSKKELENFAPDWYFIHTPTYFADPEKDGTKQKNFIIINFIKKVVLIGGTPYTGKIIEGIFSDLDFVLHLDKK